MRLLEFRGWRNRRERGIPADILLVLGRVRFRGQLHKQRHRSGMLRIRNVRPTSAVTGRRSSHPFRRLLRLFAATPDVRDETARLHFHLKGMRERPYRIQNAWQVLLRRHHMVGTERALKVLHCNARGRVLVRLTEDLGSCGELVFVPLGHQCLAAYLQIWTLRQPQTERRWGPREADQVEAFHIELHNSCAIDVFLRVAARAPRHLDGKLVSLSNVPHCVLRSIVVPGLVRGPIC